MYTSWMVNDNRSIPDRSFQMGVFMKFEINTSYWRLLLLLRNRKRWLERVCVWRQHQLVSVSRHCCGRGVEREQLARVSVAIRQVSRRALILGALPVGRSAVYLSCIPLLPPPPSPHCLLNTSSSQTLQTCRLKPVHLCHSCCCQYLASPLKAFTLVLLNYLLVLSQFYSVEFGRTSLPIYTNF